MNDALDMPLGRLQCLYYKAYAKLSTEEGRKEVQEKQAVDTISDTIQRGSV